MLANEKILLRGALSIGDFYLNKDSTKSIFLGAPVYEAAELYEIANWAGIITTPSATLTLNQINSFKEMADLNNNLQDIDIDSNIKNIFFRTPQILLPINNFLVKYNVPLKNTFDRECYAISWPKIQDEMSDTIAKTLNELLYYRKYQQVFMGHSLYTKFVNTKHFYDDQIKDAMDMDKMTSEIKNLFGEIDDTNTD
jgi:hypothetical protein